MNRTQAILRLCGGAALAGLMALAGCTKAQLQGDGPVYAVLDQLSAAAGATPTEFGGYLASDVQTFVKKNIDNVQVCVPTIYEDSGRATFHIALKDPGSDAAPTIPSPANTVSFNRYHVHYVRADGRNQQGVDVPYDFDGGMTLSVLGGNVSIGQMIVVRLQAKEEAPLLTLVGSHGAIVISTIAEVTFYGTDQAGHAVSVVGHMNVDFADWADPDC
jgi:hypothetical protein